MNKIIFIFLYLISTLAPAEEFGRLFKNRSVVEALKPTAKAIKTEEWHTYHFQGIMLINARPVKIWLDGGGKLIGKQGDGYRFNLHGKTVLLKPAQYYLQGKVLEYWQIK